MADHPNAAIARAALEAFQSGDMAKVAEPIAEDAVWHVPGSHKWAGEYRGRDDILGRFAKMAAEGLSQTQDDIHDVVGNDEHVIALVRMTITAPGGSASTNSAFIHHVKDGRARRVLGHQRQPGRDRRAAVLAGLPTKVPRARGEDHG